MDEVELEDGWEGLSDDYLVAQARNFHTYATELMGTSGCVANLCIAVEYLLKLEERRLGS